MNRPQDHERGWLPEWMAGRILTCLGLWGLWAASGCCSVGGFSDIGFPWGARSCGECGHSCGAPANCRGPAGCAAPANCGAPNGCGVPQGFAQTTPMTWMESMPAGGPELPEIHSPILPAPPAAPGPMHVRPESTASKNSGAAEQDAWRQSLDQRLVQLQEQLQGLQGVLQEQERTWKEREQNQQAQQSRLQSLTEQLASQRRDISNLRSTVIEQSQDDIRMFDELNTTLTRLASESPQTAPQPPGELPGN